MGIPLPNLDDRGYADLLNEARELLPSLAPQWTNHNPSDPGITLLELFAWLAEMLVWRTNQLPDATVLGFLKLLNGPGWAPGGRLDEDVHATVAALREPWRAVTPADYERLATSAFNAWRAAAQADENAGASLEEWYAVTRLPRTPETRPSAVARVARARCVPRRHLGAADEGERARDWPGRVSVLVVPGRADPPARGDGPPPPLAAAPPAADPVILGAVAGFLEERRLLGTRVHVAPPVYVPVRVQAAVVRCPDAPDPAPPGALRATWERVGPDDVRRSVLEAVAAWLDPLKGGPGGDGWPFGRDVHVSDLYEVMEAVRGVDYVWDLRLSSACPGGAPGCVSAAEVTHPESGEQVGLALAAHHLPRAELHPEDVHVAAGIVPVRVLVSLTPASDVWVASLERAVRHAVRGVFSPLRGGPSGEAVIDVKAVEVRRMVRSLAEVNDSQFVHVRLEADPARLVAPGDPESQAFRVEAREIAAPELTLFTDGRRLWP